MLFSIIIPVYNTEKYLKQCLQSVLQQTCQDYEIILIDDGSTDKSGTLCDEYAKIDKVTCVHQKNQVFLPPEILALQCLVVNICSFWIQTIIF